jgi:hypothetical protein
MLYSGQVNKRSAGVVQLVERFLAKEKVVGSSPIARSFFGVIKENFTLLFLDWRRGQVARQGSAKASSWVQIPSSPLII